MISIPLQKEKQVPQFFSPFSFLCKNAGDRQIFQRS